MRDKIFYYFGSSTLFLTTVILVIVLYCWFYPYKTIVFLNEPFPIVNDGLERDKDTGYPILYPGDKLYYQVEYNKYINKKCFVTRQLMNDYIITLDNLVGNVPNGYNKIKSCDVKIPLDCEPGKYYLRTTFSYQVNSLREISVIADTETFIIKK